MTFTDKTVLVADHGGLFFNVAQALAPHFKRTLYHTPTDEEFPTVLESCIGDGFDGIERCDDMWLSTVTKAVDLWVFPGLGYVGAQEHLRSFGHRVFGSGAGSTLESQRTRFLKALERHGLDVPGYDVVQGVTALAKYLRPLENKWIKLNRFRRDMETCHWRDWGQDSGLIDRLAVRLGPFREMMRFIVMDNIKTDLEIGGDMLIVDGKPPSHAVNGLEKKDKLYLAALLPWGEMPEEVREVVEPFADELQGYRGFLSTEQRVVVKGKTRDNYWTDFTGRLGFPSGNCQMRLCGNLPELMWAAAEGEALPVEPADKFAIEVLFDSCAKPGDWTGLRIPEEALPYLNLARHCEVAGVLWSPPVLDPQENVKTLGSYTVTGESIVEAAGEAQRVADLLSGLPVHLHLGGLKDLLEEAQAAEAEGIAFSGEPVPDPASVLDGGDE